MVHHGAPREPADQGQGRRPQEPAGEEGAQAPLREQVVHPGVPGAGAGRAQHGDPRLSRRQQPERERPVLDERQEGHAQDQDPPGRDRRDRDPAPLPDPLHEPDRRDLRELPEEGDRREHADQPRPRPEREGQADQDHPAGQRAHDVGPGPVLHERALAALDVGGGDLWVGGQHASPASMRAPRAQVLLQPFGRAPLGRGPRGDRIRAARQRVVERGHPAAPLRAERRVRGPARRPGVISGSESGLERRGVIGVFCKENFSKRGLVSP